MIVAAAIRHKDTGIVLTLPRPNRHMHINMVAKDHLGIDRHVVNVRFEEGFIDSRGRFLGRVRAKFIARRNGQLRSGVDPLGELFTEDLW